MISINDVICRHTPFEVERSSYHYGNCKSCGCGVFEFHTARCLWDQGLILAELIRQIEIGVHD